MQRGTSRVGGVLLCINVDSDPAPACRGWRPRRATGRLVSAASPRLDSRLRSEVQKVIYLH